MTPYKEIPELISNRVPFRGNSVTARYDGTEYQVWSYDTKVASINWPERWWIDTRVYSKTTSRIQNIVREIDKKNLSAVLGGCASAEDYYYEDDEYEDDE